VSPLSQAGSSVRARLTRSLAWAAGPLAVIAVLAGLGFIYTQTRSPAAPQTLDKLSIAVSSTPHAALLHLAAAQGFFAAEGLDATLTPVSHGKAAIDLLEQDRIDMAAAAEVPFVISVLKGSQFSIAATVASVSSEMAIVARRDRGIETPRDLIGKKIGATAGTSGEYFLWAFLIRQRIQPSSITLVDVPPGQMTQQLAQGSVDAVSTWQPVRSATESALSENAASFVEPNAYAVTHVVAARTAWLKEHRAVAEKLVRALVRAEAFARDQPQQAMALVAERLKIDPKVLRASWAELDFRVDLLQSQLITLEDEARWAMARGYAPKAALPNFLPHLYLEALLAIEPARVTVVH